MLVALLLALASCGKGKPSDTTGANSISNKLAAITAAGQPVTWEELDDWYVAPRDADNAATLYAPAFAALTKDDPKTPAFLSRNQKALQLLLRAPELKSCRYPVDLRDGYLAKLPHLRKIKDCASLLEAEAVAQAGQGHTDQASKAIVAGLRLARSLENEPVLISLLVRVAAEYIVLRGLEQVVTRKPFEGDQLLSLQAALHDTAGLKYLARALGGERCGTIQAFQVPPEERMSPFFEAEASSTDDQNDSRARSTAVQKEMTARLTAHRKTPAWHEDFNFALDYFASLLAAAEKPLPEALASFADAEAQIDEAKPKGLLISALLLPATARAAARFGNATARVCTAQAALAVERYRHKHDNALPVSLDALVPEFLAAVPADPFDGQPLRYEKLVGRGYVVYSVGRDLQDNHGASAPAGGKGASPPDITFAVRR
jgi:hypothetical protein